MTAETYTVYDKETRLPVGHLTCAAGQLDANVLHGHLAIKGRLGLGNTRLGDDDAPVEDKGRADSEERARLRGNKLARIEELERNQARRVRELLAKDDKRLKEIDLEIAALRADL